MNAARPAFGAAVLVSLALVAATALREPLSGHELASRLLGPLDLGSENNVGAWWSGILFLLAGLRALDRAEDAPADAAGRKVRGAWWMIAAVLVFFSLAEIGSLHERLGAVGWWLGYSEWVPLGLLGAVLAGVALVGLHRLWRAPDHRRAAVWIFAGFAILATVVPQEYLEHRISWPGPTARGARRAVEEGTELLGALVILRAATANLLERTGPGGAAARHRAALFVAVGPPTRGAVLVGAAACVVFAWITASLGDQQRGHPADWLAAAAFLGAALWVIRSTRWSMGPPPGLPKLAPSAALASLAVLPSVAVLASLAAVATNPVGLAPAGPFWQNTRLSLLAGLVAAFAVGGYLVSGRIKTFGALLLVTGAVACAGIVWSSSHFVSYLSTCLLALATYTAVTHGVARW